jgi:arsenate reductase (thioredoxin)
MEYVLLSFGAPNSGALRAMNTEVIKVLVLCTGNSCRSIMAEALINDLHRDHYRAWSAGSHPTGAVHPKSLETLQRHGIDPGQPRSKSWNEFADQPFDLVITVCDLAARENCPVFIGTPTEMHWSTPDLAKVIVSDIEIDAAFNEAFMRLKNRIENLTH